MHWYYAEGQQQVGPLGEEEFLDLARRGIVHPDTLVWHEGMSDWQPYRQVRRAEPPPSTKACAECGRAFSAHELVLFGDRWVCGACKPAFFQRLKETGAVGGALRYGGFWLRFCAEFLDWIIVALPGFLLNALGGLLGGGSQDGARALGLQTLVSLLQLAVGVAYHTWFIGTHGATPGKMAVGLKVVTPDGGRISYGRAFGRYFAKILSAVILTIGYLMAAFDAEKRALHDRICDTRVVKVR